MINLRTLALSGLLASSFAFAQSTTAEYFESIKTKPQQLMAFLRAMPKGGDLHNHLAGASYAENMIRYARNTQWCVDQQTLAVFTNPQCEPQNLIKNAAKYPLFYQQIVRAWSMLNFQDENESGHDHFFSTFGKYHPISKNYPGSMLAETANRAGLQNESYMEIMITADNNKSGLLGKDAGWNPNLESLRQQLLNKDFAELIKETSISLDKIEDKKNSILACKSKDPKPGCQVKIRYLYQVLREQPPEMVFAQILAGFELASRDPRVVGINLVQAEDGPIAMRDYSLHMKMVGYLHQLYPQVSISLHAGELTEALVGKPDLESHITQAINLGKAQRIGHGVAIKNEENLDQLLQIMAEKGILVEINLTSNAGILQVSKETSPLPFYLQHGVPLTLSTDDEGVNRSNLSKEYKRAVEDFDLKYTTLKTFVRNSLSYSFLPGLSLWQDSRGLRPQLACQNDRLGTATPSKSCRNFLKTSEKAALQWDLEKRFERFERDFS